jgi:3-hydroxyisobutyrate dehydrogenase
MAHRLVEAGFELHVIDKSPARVEQFLAGDAAHAWAKPHTSGHIVDVLITMLPDGASVRKVLLGDAGIAASLRPGTTVIDMSSSSAVGTRSLAETLAENDIRLIDAPVSGGVKKAIDGSLAIMAGGDEAVVDHCRPVLEVMGHVYYAGTTGSGHAMKALNNYLSAASLASAAEAIIAGCRFGLDPSRMIEILNVSSGRSNSTENKFPGYILNNTYNSGFGIGLLAKDLRLALEIMQATEAPANLLKSCAGLWQAAEQHLGASADHTEVIKYLEFLCTRSQSGENQGNDPI